MSEILIKPTKRYRDLSELVSDAAALYGDKYAFK